MCCQEKLFVFLRAQIGGGRWFTDLEGKAWKRPGATWGRKELRASGRAEQQMDERIVSGSSTCLLGLFRKLHNNKRLQIKDEMF